MFYNNGLFIFFAREGGDYQVLPSPRNASTNCASFANCPTEGDPISSLPEAGNSKKCDGKWTIYRGFTY